MCMHALLLIREHKPSSVCLQCCSMLGWCEAKLVILWLTYVCILIYSKWHIDHLKLTLWYVSFFSYDKQARSNQEEHMDVLFYMIQWKQVIFYSKLVTYHTFRVIDRSHDYVLDVFWLEQSITKLVIYDSFSWWFDGMRMCPLNHILLVKYYTKISYCWTYGIRINFGKQDKFSV